MLLDRPPSTSSMRLEMDGSAFCEPRRQVAHVHPLPASGAPRRVMARPRPQPGRVPQGLCCRCAGPAFHWSATNDNDRRQHQQRPLKSFEETFQQYYDERTDSQTFAVDNMVEGSTCHVTSPTSSTASNNVTSDFISWKKIPRVLVELGSPVSHWHDDDMDLSSALNYPKTGLSDPAKCMQGWEGDRVRAVQCVQPLQQSDSLAAASDGVRVLPEKSLNSRNCNHAVSDLGLLSADSVPNNVTNYCSLTGNKSKLDLYCLVRSFDQLAKCGFYYPKLTMPQAKKKLLFCPVGTFLLRDSSDQRFLVSLSIRTGRGTTSIRVAYSNGRFLLDCEDRARHHMPAADSIVGLVQEYVLQTASPSANNCVFLESNGRRDTPVRMTRPCIDSAQSLKHLARISLNRLVLRSETNGSDHLQRLPLALQGYMGDYIYCV